MFLFQWFLFSKWKYVVLYIVLLFVAFYWIYNKNLYFECACMNDWACSHVGIIACIVITIRNNINEFKIIRNNFGL